MADQPNPEEIRKWQRWFAVECNNRAWDLAAQTSWTDREKQEMHDAAFAARYHWSQVGNDLNAARADGLAGQVLALLRQGPEAVRYAESNFRFITAQKSPDWEVAFAHAILANAAAANGEKSRHAELDASAEKLGGALEADDKSVFNTLFRRVAP